MLSTCNKLVVSSGMPSNFIAFPLIDFFVFPLWVSKRKYFGKNRFVVVIVDGMKGKEWRLSIVVVIKWKPCFLLPF